MKNSKIISVFFIILLLLSSNISFADTGIVNTPAVRIREKASTNSKVLTRAYEDDEIEILEEEGDWYKVKFEDKTGYASKSLIKKKENGSTDKVNENTVSNYKVEEEPKKEEPKKEEPKKEDVKEEKTAEDNKEDSSKTVIRDDTVSRVMPNFASNEFALLTKGTEIKILRELNNWTEISVNNQNMWILKNRIAMASEIEMPKQEENEKTENAIVENDTVEANNTEKTENNNVTSEPRNTKGIVNVETANVREKANTNSKVIGKLDEDTEVTILGEEGDFYKISTSNIKSGYIAKRLVKVSNVSSRGTVEVREEVVQDTSKTEELEEKESNNKGTQVVEFAKQYLGYDYVLGGKTPETGFDCSGYTRYVFKNFGYNLGTVAADQNSIGTEIERSDLQEGDLILFYNEGNTKIGHTGIYIGNNEFIHAANPDRGVVTDNLVTNSYYSTRFVTARRIVE